MRRGEVLGTRWQDVNLDEGFLSVRQQISRKLTEAGEVWAVVPPKTEKGRRRIDLDPETVALLRRHKASRRPTR
jgi:integrase